MKKRKRILIYSVVLILILGIFSLWWSGFVSKSTSPVIQTEVTRVTKKHVALLLGTSKYVAKGQVNLYYKYRIEAIAELYKAGKIDYVLVSGDNSTIYYNEPTTMLNDLVAVGIPKEKIIQDFAGFRTLDSVVRAKKVFGQDKLIIVSQRFHIERALFIAKQNDIEAIGYCAKDVSAKYGAKTRFREHFARIKMFLDLFILNKEPKFLGDPVVIPS